MKNLISKLHFSILFLLSTSLLSFSQNAFKFQRFGVEQGLTVTTAFSIVQDDRGFLWISTIDGLHRYDGYNFITYKNNFNDSLSLSDNTLSTIFKDSKGFFWVGTYNEGVNKFDPKTGRSIRYKNKISDLNSLSNNRVWCVCEDAKGRIWIGTEKGLNLLDPTTGKITRFDHPDGDFNSELGSDRVLSLGKDKKNNIWIGTDHGLHLEIENAGGKISFQGYFHSPGDPNSISSDIILSIYQGNDNLWIGTVDGLNKLENDHFKTIRFTADSSSKKNSKEQVVYSYLNSYGANSIRGVWQRNENEIWLATDKGIKVLDLPSGKFAEYHSDPLDPFSLSAELCLSFCLDRSGNLWIGTMAGGINKLDLKPKKFMLIQTEFGNPYNLSIDNIRSVFKDLSGTLWVGTLGGGLNKWNKDKGKFERIRHLSKNANENFDPEIVWCIKEDWRGCLWVGTSDGLWCYDPVAETYSHFVNDPKNKNSISNNIVRCLLQAGEYLWIGTEGGLNYFDFHTRTFTHCMHTNDDRSSISNNTIWTIKEVNKTIWIGTDDGLNEIADLDLTKTETEHIPFVFKKYNAGENKKSLSNKSVRAIYQDVAGTLWIGTNNGLNKFNDSTKEFQRFSEEDGLPNSFIYAIQGDSKNGLWISTNFGLSRFDVKEKKFRNYDKLDGLQNNEFNTGAYFKTEDGELYFGGPDGLNCFYPEAIQENRVPPPVVITSIKLFGEEMKHVNDASEIKNITLRYDENVISFEFTSLDLTQPEKNNYAYQLVGFDKQLIRSGNRRFVNYTNLDPGEYTFKVFGCNNDGVWNNEGVSIYITIVPPFWKTWWFTTASIAFVIFSVYFFISTRIRRLRKTQDMLELQVQIKTKELREEKELVESQKKVIERTNQNMTSSIRYAKRIQESILPMKEKLNELVPESFIFFRPKDIVSGDFYWFAKTGTEGAEKIMVAAVDCTGHGVPGAFMSLIGNNLLNNIVINKKMTDPKKILEKLHDGVVLALKKDEQESGTVDGMDITLCVIDVQNSSLEFAATGRSLLLVNANGLKKHKVGKHPVGFVSNKEAVFEKEKIQLNKGDTFYIFTDGYCDQFGGKEDDKFMESNFEKLLLEIKDRSMQEQASVLETTIDKWKGKTPQLDDILVIGLRF